MAKLKELKVGDKVRVKGYKDRAMIYEIYSLDGFTAHLRYKGNDGQWRNAGYQDITYLVKVKQNDLLD